MRLISKCIFMVLLLPLHILHADSIQKADAVLVIKSERRLYLMKNNELLEKFKVTFGGNPKGHKEAEGDEKTPEGHYRLGYKNLKSRFYKSIHISYPNRKDRANAKRLGVKPGGNIMIHGQKNGWEWVTPLAQLFSWTNGCIALSNKDMDKIWMSVDPGTPIEIRP